MLQQQRTRTPCDRRIIAYLIVAAMLFVGCGGAFSRSAQDYDKRRVVRAHRVS